MEMLQKVLLIILLAGQLSREEIMNVQKIQKNLNLVKDTNVQIKEKPKYTPLSG